MKNIVIMPENLKIQAQEGKTILEIAQDFDLDIDGSCGGKGTCGKCRVNIDEGNGLQEVLACQFRLQRDLTIWPCRKMTGQIEKPLSGFRRISGRILSS